MYTPERDGVDHLNVYSKGKEELGRWMSNFAREPIETKDGQFVSIEGYWYWLGCRDDRLRNLSGFAAKQLGRELQQTFQMTIPEFQAAVEGAIRAKAKKRPDMVTKLKACVLPLAHYYVFGNPPVVKDAGHKWILDIWDKIRKEA
jgi:hypothetical protein